MDGKVKRVDEVLGAGEAARAMGLGGINEGTVPQAREGGPAPSGPSAPVSRTQA